MGENKCGECTVCCTLSVVEEVDKKAGEDCKHCILKKGCGIYKTRPQVCKDFECAYLQSNTPSELRPDKCGVMFVKINDRIFTGIAVPGISITDIAKGQINAFNKQGFSVIMLKEKTKPLILSPKNHDKEEIYKEYLTELNNGNL